VTSGGVCPLTPTPNARAARPATVVPAGAEAPARTSAMTLIRAVTPAQARDATGAVTPVPTCGATRGPARAMARCRARAAAVWTRAVRTRAVRTRAVWTHVAAPRPAHVATAVPARGPVPGVTPGVTRWAPGRARASARVAAEVRTCAAIRA
jgi:hypothetical protein